MELFRLILSLSFLLLFQPCFSQEICDNGIDDDGDLLIDLNDEECTCPETRPFSNIKGNICGNGLVLQMEDSLAIQHQWYKDGIALLGETNFEITIVQVPGVEGVYNALVTTASGCYFSEPYELIVESYEVYLGEEIICDGESVQFGNFSISVPGFFQNNLVATNGCDSIVSLDVIVIDPVYTDVEDTFCEGETYYLNEVEATEEGMYQSILVAASGCDSIVRLELSYKGMIESGITAEICESQVYTFGEITADASGQYQTIIENPTSCDTLYTIDLIVLENSTSFIEVDICDGDVYSALGLSATISGSYQAELIADNGCDSIVNIQLTVNDNYEVSIQESICQDDIFILNDIETDQAGLYQTIFTTINGCDSIVNVELEVSNIIEIEFTEVVCAGETFIYNDIVATASGDYQTIISSSDSCDSIIDITLTVIEPVDLYLEEMICEGETFVYNDVQAMVTGIYQTTMTDVNGCDAMMYLELDVIANTSSFINAQICEGETYSFFDVETIQSGQFQTIIQNSAGCDSIIDVQVDVLPINERYYSLRLCEDDVFNFYGQAITSAGVYKHQFSNIDQCDSLVVVEIEFSPRESLFQVEDYIEVNIGERIDISPLYLTNEIIYVNWMSDDGSMISLSEELYDYLPVSDQTIMLIVEDINGCQQMQEIEIRVDVFADIYIPNVINLSSTDNNIFRPYTNDAVSELKRFDVFDRWGNHIFETDGSIQDFEVWDGRYLEKRVEEGVYTYQMVFELIDGSITQRAGTVTVLY